MLDDVAALVHSPLLSCVLNDAAALVHSPFAAYYLGSYRAPGGVFDQTAGVTCRLRVLARMITWSILIARYYRVSRGRRLVRRYLAVCYSGLSNPSQGVEISLFRISNVPCTGCLLRPTADAACSLLGLLLGTPLLSRHKLRHRVDLSLCSAGSYPGPGMTLAAITSGPAVSLFAPAAQT